MYTLDGVEIIYTISYWFLENITCLWPIIYIFTYLVCFDLWLSQLIIGFLYNRSINLFLQNIFIFWIGFFVLFCFVFIFFTYLFIFLNFILFLIEVQLIYNVVLVFGVQQSDSVCVWLCVLYIASPLYMNKFHSRSLFVSLVSS